MKKTLSQQITELKGDPNDLECERVIGRGIIILMQRQPLYGLLLAKLNRVSSHRLTSPIGITWFNRRVVLTYNTSVFAKRISVGDELLFWLEHEALHLIWLHPVRYPQNSSITQMATDMAVNQLIPTKITDELTLNEVNQALGLHLPANVNSRFYVNKLTKFFKQLRTHGRDKRLTNQRIKKIVHGTDDHNFWGNEPQLSRQVKTLQLKKLIQRSYQSTTAKARGTLPGKVHDQLKRLTVPSPVNWRAYVKVGLGGVPFGRKASRARFNRRQAYRMDLMGSVSNYVQPVSIFVDNSGSMGDSEISYLLGQIVDFLKHFPVNVDVYSFDSRVHGARHYRTNNLRQLKFVRIGGGGTRFQSIFDYCQAHLEAERNRLIIILTDGYGESHLNYYGFTNLLWILTRPQKEFSVKNRRGQLVSLFNQPILNAFENK